MSWESRACRHLLWRVDDDYAFERTMAGYGTTGSGVSQHFVNTVAAQWCAGDVGAATWVLSRIWLRERTLRWLRALPLLVVTVLAVARVSWWFTPLVFVALFFTRTKRQWVRDVSGRHMSVRFSPEVVPRHWSHRSRLRMRMLKRRGRMLPAAILNDATSADVLLKDCPPEVRETALALCDEWHGDVAGVVAAAYALNGD